MRVIIAAVAVLAVAAAAVYVSRGKPDNAGTAAGAREATAAITPGSTRPSGNGSRLNVGKVAAFVYKSQPEAVPTFQFFDGEHQTKTIDAFKGKVVLLNIWATWCGPCREEMPSLDRLQRELGSDRFEVVAVSVDKNGFDRAKEFLQKIDVKTLNFYSDPTSRAAIHVKAIGMPASLLVDAEGREIGRLMGPAEWDSPEAKRLIEAALH